MDSQGISEPLLICWWGSGQGLRVLGASIDLIVGGARAQGIQGILDLRVSGYRVLRVSRSWCQPVGGWDWISGCPRAGAGPLVDGTRSQNLLTAEPRGLRAGVGLLVGGASS